MKKYLLSIFFGALILSCSKDESHSYAYWSALVNQKYQEINKLTQSVPCHNIDDFELVRKNGYYLVHPSIRNEFDQLMTELDRLQTEAGKAADRGGIMFTTYEEPNPPVRQACVENKATLIYAQQLSLEDIESEMAFRYPEIKNFYNDVSCTNPDDWSGYFLRIGCCFEGVAIHKTIRSGVFYEKIQIFNRLNQMKLAHQKESCINSNCLRFAKPVQCVDGKPFVELTTQ